MSFISRDGARRTKNAVEAFEASGPGVFRRRPRNPATSRRVMLKIGACGNIEATGSDNADPRLYNWTLVTLNRTTGQYVAGDPAKTGIATAREVNEAVGVPQNTIVEAWRAGANAEGNPVFLFAYNAPVPVTLESTSGDAEAGWTYKAKRKDGSEVIAENLTPFLAMGLDVSAATAGYGKSAPGGAFLLWVTNETLLTESCNA